MKYKKIILIILSLTLILIVSCQKIKPLDDTEFLKSIDLVGCDDLDEGMSKGQDIFFPSYAAMYYYENILDLDEKQQRLIAPDQCIDKKTLNEGKCLEIPKELQKQMKNQYDPSIPPPPTLKLGHIRGHMKVTCPEKYVCAQTVPESYAQRITKYWNEIPKEDLKQEIIARAEGPELEKLRYLDEDEWQELIEIERHERIQLDLSQATFGACVPEAEQEEKSLKRDLPPWLKEPNIVQERR